MEGHRWSDCDNGLFTYFWQCVVHYHYASGITPTPSSFHPSFTHLLMKTMTINVYLPHISSTFCPVTLYFPPVVLFAQLSADAWTLSSTDLHMSL